jgi:hypothetical protein
MTQYNLQRTTTACAKHNPNYLFCYNKTLTLGKIISILLERTNGKVSIGNKHKQIYHWKKFKQMNYLVYKLE